MEMWDGNKVQTMGLIQFKSFSGKGGVALTKLGCGFKKSLFLDSNPIILNFILSNPHIIEMVSLVTYVNIILIIIY